MSLCPSKHKNLSFYLVWYLGITAQTIPTARFITYFPVQISHPVKQSSETKRFQHFTEYIYEIHINLQ